MKMADGLHTGAEIAAALQSLEAALSSEVARARTAAARDTVSSLHNAVRRLRQAESREEWIRTFSDVAAVFCQRAAFFALSSRGLSVNGADVHLASAPAVASAVESKDTVVSACTAGELSETVASVMNGARRVVLSPVLVNDKAVGVLCADFGEQNDATAIELLAALASASVVSAPETTVESRPTELVRIAAVPEPAKRPTWEDLSRREQSLHLKAQQFARTTIAQLLLYKPEAVRRGRTSSNLYGNLREEIDEGREAFHRQFIDTCPSMVDYFHLELVRTLAKDDSHALGPDYPGPLP